MCFQMLRTFFSDIKENCQKKYANLYQSLSSHEDLIVSKILKELNNISKKVSYFIFIKFFSLLSI